MDGHQQIKENVQKPTNALTPVAKFSNQFPQQVNDHTTTQPIELTNATGTHLDHLNDDCLLEIFAQNSLPAMDLCALAETCKLFKRIAQRVFPKKLAIEWVYANSIYRITSKDKVRATGSAQDVERMFKHFGSSIVALSVSGIGNGMYDLRNWLAKHCVGTLKELEFHRAKFTKSAAVGWGPIFRHLQKFSICDSRFDCKANGFANLDSLIELSSIGETMPYELLVSNFPKLHRFTFEGEFFYVDSHILLSFLERHKTLKCLKLEATYFEEIRDILSKLDNGCQEFEELDFRFSDSISGSGTLDFSHFQSLKRLRLHCGYNGDNPSIVGLQKLSSLEVLIISGKHNCKELPKVLPLLQNLRELNVNLDSATEKVQWTLLTQLTKLLIPSLYPLPIDNVVDIVRRLKNLQELDIYPVNFVLSEKEFYEIVSVVKGRPNVLTLTCLFADLPLVRNVRNVRNFTNVSEIVRNVRNVRIFCKKMPEMSEIL